MKDNATQKEWLINTIGKIVQYEVSKTAKNLDNLETIVEYEVRKALKTILKELRSQIKQEILTELRQSAQRPQSQQRPTSKQPQSQTHTPKFQGQNSILAELLNSTKPLSNEEIAVTNNSVLDLAKSNKLKSNLANAFTRDYRELVEAMETPVASPVAKTTKKSTPQSTIDEKMQLRNSILNKIELQPFDEDDSWLKDVE
jgi:uncharacterized protein with von Willebrand factor type A (vWA) domain